MTNEEVFQMPFGRVYSLLENKTVRKGRTKEEVRIVATWLTGYSAEDLDRFLETDMTYGEFFSKAPCPNPNRALIRGTVCGIRVESIDDPLMREIRYLDKLIDELAKGKALEKILRHA